MAATIQSRTAMRTLAGASGNAAPLVGVLYAFGTVTGNAGAGEDTLASYSVPANTLSANLKALRFTVFGTSVANANAKTVKLKFGAATFMTIALTAGSARDWIITGTVLRLTASVQHAWAQGVEETVVNTVGTTIAEDLTTALTAICTGEAVADNDITLYGFIIEILN